MLALLLDSNEIHTNPHYIQEKGDIISKITKIMEVIKVLSYGEPLTQVAANNSKCIKHTSVAVGGRWVAEIPRLHISCHSNDPHNSNSLKPAMPTCRGYKLRLQELHKLLCLKPMRLGKLSALHL